LHTSPYIPTEIHFTVRLTLSNGHNSSEPVKTWSTSWITSPASDASPDATTRIQWYAPEPRRRAINNLNPGNFHAPSQSTDPSSTSITTAPTLLEHPLAKFDKEYDLLYRWSKDLFQIPQTDRGAFVQLQKAVQEDGARKALSSFAKLLREHMKFEQDSGKLAVDMLYQGYQN
jgi:hypothetical protein